MTIVDKINERKFRWSYLNNDTHKIHTIYVSRHQVYSIAYAQYNNAFLRMMVLSPDICPCLSKKVIDKHVEQLLGIIGTDCEATFACSIQNYFFTLFAGELQCQILN